MGELKEWALSVETSMMMKHFSNWDYTFEFTHPNVLRVSPDPAQELGSLTIEYEVGQQADFSGIPNDIQTFFLDFAAADVGIVIGRIRKKYEGQMRTPFGEIPISSEIYQESVDKKRELIDKFQMALPNITIDFG